MNLHTTSPAPVTGDVFFAPSDAETDFRSSGPHFIDEPKRLARILGIDASALAKVHAHYPLRLNTYYLKLIQRHGAPLWQQAIPALCELHDASGMEDPLAEEDLSPVPGLVHKYPQQALFLVCSECAMYCRFCTRKRKVGKASMRLGPETIRAGLDYLRKTPEIRDVLLSGGDPLMLNDKALEAILRELRRIPSIELIRIGTRIPCTLPMRVTEGLARMLKKYHPLYINTQFNHPAELTPEACMACKRLADAGIPLGCQTVLLRGINDSPDILERLFYGLLAMRVKPYYLFQMDLTKGTAHFRTTISQGQEIMRNLLGRVSGMALPAYALDTPGGGGKIPLTPNYLEKLDSEAICRPPLGTLCAYPNTTI